MDPVQLNSGWTKNCKTDFKMFGIWWVERYVYTNIREQKYMFNTNNMLVLVEYLYKTLDRFATPFLNSVWNVRVRITVIMYYYYYYPWYSDDRRREWTREKCYGTFGQYFSIGYLYTIYYTIQSTKNIFRTYGFSSNRSLRTYND